MTPEFVAALHPDPRIARLIAFGLVVAVVAEGRKWLPSDGEICTDVVPYLDVIDAKNSLFAVGPRAVGYDRASIAPLAVRDFAGWVRAQRLDREPPLVAYELAMLALGAELPSVVLRSLREAELTPDATTFETPDGGGYATAFLATYHPEWRGRALLGASTETGARLAAFASALRADTLGPTGNVVLVREGVPDPELPTVDLLLIYNPPPWYGDPATVRRRIAAHKAILA